MYATIDDLIARYGADELLRLAVTYDSDGNEVVDSDKITAALEAASALMRSYLPSDIDTTIEAHNLKRVCGDLARYELYDQRTTDVVAERHEQALKWLREVLRGNAIVAHALQNFADTTATGGGDVQFGANTQTQWH